MLVDLSELMDLTVSDLVKNYNLSDKIIDIVNPPPRGTFWTRSEELRILELESYGLNINEIAFIVNKELGCDRSPNSVFTRLKYLLEFEL